MGLRGKVGGVVSPAQAANRVLLERSALTHLEADNIYGCLLYTSPSPRDRQKSRMPSSA